MGNLNDSAITPQHYSCAYVCSKVRARGANETGDAQAKGGNGGAVTLVGNYAN